METKKCNKCGKEKPLTEYSYRNDTHNYKNTCKECINKAHREYRQSHLQEMREKDRKYHEEHKETRNKKNKAYAQKNKEKIAEYKHKYYENNKVDILNKNKKYVEENKETISNYQKQYRNNNKEKLHEYQLEYYQLNKEYIQEQHKQYIEENKEKLSKLWSEYYKTHKEEIKAYQETYKKNNPSKVKDSQQRTYQKRKNNFEYLQKKKAYRLANIEKEKQYMKEYRKQHRKEIYEYLKKRQENDKVFALKTHIRKTIYDSFKRKNFTKNSKSTTILGCDIDTFIKHLLDTYKNNYGEEWNGIEKVHIDHIVPLSKAKTEEEVIKLCHYTNLQLLKAKDNLLKSDKETWNINNKKEEE